MPPGISVVIPVGPLPCHQEWLGECLESVVAQTVQPNHVVLVDDMAGLPDEDESDRRGPMPLSIWRSPWHLGVAHAFNIGVALATGPLVFLLGSDDTLEPDCLERCLAEYSSVDRQHSNANLGYYYVGLRYMDDGSTQCTPCAAAMVHKDLWKATGGFPTESATGASDAALVSIIWGRKIGFTHAVDEHRVLYNYRRHPGTDTASKAAWQRVILETRDLVTREWKKPEWGRGLEK